MGIKAIYHKAKSMVKDGANEIGKWYLDHEQTIKDWAPVIAAGTSLGVVKGIKYYNKQQAKFEAECDIYDPHTFTHYYSKRPLKPSERDRLDDMVKNGMTVGEALNRMGLRGKK